MIHAHTIHVWYIYLRLVDFYGKWREIYHTWIVWDVKTMQKTCPLVNGVPEEVIQYQLKKMLSE